jgi:inosine-uridine nucleoside N-ribohydrolase
LDRRRIRVVTDQGFDDWGAFAVLDVAGLAPERALASHGMMSTAFAGNFSKILDSWGLATSVYRGTDTCFGVDECALDDSFIEDDWHYRSKIWGSTSLAIRAGYSGTEQVNEELADFWSCDDTSEEKVTLLILGPVSDAATWLSNASEAFECIDEIILSGSFFSTSNQGSRMRAEDPETFHGVLVGLADNVNHNLTHSKEGELNVVADAPAAHQLLAFVREHGVRLRIVPLEVESASRIGKDMMKVLRGDSDTARQENLNQASFDKLCGIGLRSSTPSLLSNMACLSDASHDRHVLDMDAIVATSIWTPEFFTFAQRHVSIDASSGLTSLCQGGSETVGDDSCVAVEVATDFDALRWFENLQDAVQWQVNRGLNCYPTMGADDPTDPESGNNNPWLTAADLSTAETRCWQACQGTTGCTGFVIGAESEAAYDCYLRSNIDTGSCSSDTSTGSFATYVVRPNVTKYADHNCYSDHGAEDDDLPSGIPNDPFLRVEAPVLGWTTERAAQSRCTQACSAVQGCTGFVLGADGDAYECYLRSKIRPEHCVQGGGLYATYVL